MHKKWRTVTKMTLATNFTTEKGGLFPTARADGESQTKIPEDQKFLED